MTSAPMSRRKRFILIPPALTIAWWRLRLTWKFLSLFALGTLSAVMLISAMPLFTQIALSAGFRQSLRQTTNSSEFDINVTVNQLSDTAIKEATQKIDALSQATFGSFLTGAPIVSSQYDYQSALPVKQNQTNITYQAYGYNLADITPFITVLQGTSPQNVPDTLQIAVSSDTAAQYHLTVGSTIDFITFGPPSASGPKKQQATVTEIFIVNSVSDPIWLGNSFQPQNQGQMTIIPFLTSTDILLSHNPTDTTVSQGPNFATQPVRLVWAYHFNPDNITINNISTLSTAISNYRNQIQGALSSIPQIENAYAFGQAFDSIQNYGILYALIQVPVSIILIQVLGLVIFFVSISAEIFVDRQSDALVLMRSRGASRGQVFSGMIMQTLLASLIAMIIGAALSLPLVYFFANRMLSAQDRSAIDIVTKQPLQALFSIRWYAFVAVIGSILASVISLSRTTGLNILSSRRESGRSTQKPLWQRLNLDIIGALFGILLYAAYEFGLQKSDPNVKRALSVFSLLIPILLLSSSAVIFTRLFPLFARLGAWIASRLGGAPGTIAFTQLARQPKQMMRTILLLSLSIGFAIFSFLFIASQQQRVYDVAAYAVGADISGNLLPITTTTQQTPTSIAATYATLPGVQSTSVGASILISPNGNSANQPLSMLAVDSNTYGATAIWPSQASQQSLATLLAALTKAGSQAINNDTVPVIVDDAAAASLSLNNGATFTLSVPGYSSGSMHFAVIDQVHHIPQIYDDATAKGNFYDQNMVSGGFLVDYSAYAAIFAKDNPGTTSPPNYIWLKTTSDANTLASLRGILKNGTQHLQGFKDRRSQISALQEDPLQATLLGILEIGAITSLILALLGTTITSWLNARNRTLNYTIQRALGFTNGQLARELIYENLFVYLTASAVGFGLGTILATLVLPAVVFISSANTNNAVPAIDVPPIQMVVPWHILSFIIGGIILFIVAATGFMIRSATRPAIGQTLRMNED